DIAHDKGAIARHLDNIAKPNQRYAELAVDDDPNTCSSTDFATSSRTEPPWWRIWFPNSFSFSNIELTINKTTLQYLCNVSVSVTNMTETESKDKKHWLTDDLCYQGDGFKLSKDSDYAIIRFYCISLPFGNTIKITLGSNKSQLEICDVNINQACDNNTFGSNCSITCNEHCTGLCDSVNGTCSVCSPGYKGQFCNETCDKNTYGQNCTNNCSKHCSEPCNNVNGSCGTCKPGYKEQFCNKPCAINKWGMNCNKTCGQCATKECNSYNGSCEMGCKAGYQLKTCQEPCDDLSFGVNCSGTCNSTCKGPCNKTNGMCLDCQSGWNGSYCDKACPNGTFGLNCSQNCSEHCERTCDHVDGNCSCQKGYQLPMCINECELGTWGKNCSQTCGGCHSENCNKTTGQCLSGCKPGYKITSDCMEECDAGKYGNNCSGTCSKNCEDPKTCNKTNGFCASCEPGWRRPKCNDSCPDLWYGQNCQETCGYCAECEAGSHGVDCQERCGMCAEDKVCHPGNGTCPLGCKMGFSGEGCTQKLKAPSEPYTVALGVGGGVLVLTIIAAVVVVLVMRKRKAAKSQKNLPANITQKSAEIQHLGTSKAPKKSTDGVEESMKKQDKSLPVAPTEDPSVVQEPTYGNMMDEEGPRKPVTLSHLLSYIVTKSADQTYFRNEYAAIPTGMIHPATAARDPANAGKSRYKNLYAYDHSRVHLKKQQGGTDYINACYIQGYSGRPEYIASQGPMDAMIEDFIRMIWEKDVITVVMVTNLVELGKIKCLQYWGEVNVEKEIGMFVVVLTAEQEKSDFVTNRDVARSVRQFHYTAWPDKDVPDSPASLLVFWYTVRAYDPRCAGPWLSQYKFLHEVMYEALVLSSWPVPVDEFPKEHQRLLQVDPVLNKTNILLEYENEKAYQTMVLSKVRLDSDGQEIDAFRFAKLPENVGKNRSQSVLAQNMYRPFLRTPVSGRNDYINAVYIPTLSDRYAFVVSQTPLEYTLVDFCRLIHDHDIRIVVSFPDEGRELVGRLPTSGSSTIGPFTVRLEKEKTSDSIIHRKYSLANKTGVTVDLTK
ncbi:PTPRT-like protein, partial [Mya arenaria]